MPSNVIKIIAETEMRRAAERKRVREAEDRGFLIGLTYAAATIYRTWGHHVEAMQLLANGGITEAKLKELKIDPYDAKPCREILRLSRPLSKRRRRA